MKILAVLSLSILLCSCSAWPEFFQASEKILTDTAIKVEISEEVITPNTDLDVIINFNNQMPPVQPGSRISPQERK